MKVKLRNNWYLPGEGLFRKERNPAVIPGKYKNVLPSTAVVLEDDDITDGYAKAYAEGKKAAEELAAADHNRAMVEDQDVKTKRAEQQSDSLKKARAAKAAKDAARKAAKEE